MIALSDSTGGRHDARRARRRGRARPQAQRAAGWPTSTAASAISNEELLELPCDVLAPCALEQVITGRTPTGSGRGSCSRARTAPRRRTPTRSSRPRACSCPRRARERGRRRRLVLRVGAGPPGVLLDGGRGERAAPFDRLERLRETWDLHESRGVPMRTAAYGLGSLPRRRGDHDPRPLPVDGRCVDHLRVDEVWPMGHNRFLTT